LDIMIQSSDYQGRATARITSSGDGDFRGSRPWRFYAGAGGAQAPPNHG